MKVKYTTQEVINLASALYDDGFFDRADVQRFLYRLSGDGAWKASQATIDRVFDLIVG